ncbi:MAG: bacteriohemerythrin [Pseudooceanicola sp.]
MKWQPHYATGDKLVDDQHKTLFSASDQFRDTLESGGGEKTYDLFLQFLTTYAEAHFSVEERCMLEHRCPVAECNKHEHTQFFKVLRRENERFAEEGYSRSRAMAMVDWLDRWLDSHICRIDIRLRDVIDQDQ